MTRTLRAVLTLGFAVLALIFVGSALAGSKPPAYQGTAGNTQGTVQKGAQPSTGTTNTVGQLPFTGLDLGLFAAGGAALVAAGFSLRRLDARHK